MLNRYVYMYSYIHTYIRTYDIYIVITYASIAIVDDVDFVILIRDIYRY